MKRYQDMMDQLRFTPEQKAHMVDQLMAAAERPAPRRALPLRRLAAVGVAASLALSVSVAGATGALDSVSNTFAGLFGRNHTEIIDQIGYPIGASDTADGITITADAILGDTYNYAIVYSIQREDGAPLVGSDILAQAADTVNGALPLSFERYDLRQSSPLAGLFTGGGGGFSYFYDADPSDNAIQFVEYWSSSSPIRPTNVTVTFQDLYDLTDDYANNTLLAEGPWTLEFHMAFEDSSVSLPAGQDIQVGGMDATLDALTLSPLSIMIEYTVHQEVPEAGLQTGREDADSDPFAPFRDLPVTITCTDGSILEIESANTSTHSGGGHSKCTLGVMFDTIRPLDEIASVTVGDVTIPVSQ